MLEPSRHEKGLSPNLDNSGIPDSSTGKTTPNAVNKIGGMVKTPDTPAHTPLPWHIEEGHIQRDSNGIRYWQITDGQDAIACNQFCYAGYDPEVNAANAALIVRAVNSHEALIAALESALEIAESWTHDQLDGTSAFNGAWAELGPVRAALTKAKAGS